MTLTVPELSLVVLVGVSGSGKSTLARRLFKPTEVLSSDAFRGWVSDDENNQSATADAFEALHFILRKRLAAGRLTVVDATNVQPESRKPLLQLAREFHCLPVAIVLDVPERLAHERNRARPDRNFGPHVIRQQASQLHRSLRDLSREGFRRVHVLRTPEQIGAVELVREPLWNNRKSETGPFDVIGDVHGCFEELTQLLALLGYTGDPNSAAQRHPAGRKLIFVGDLVDRGPQSPEVVRLVRDSVQAGTAFCVPGNHDVKLLRKLRGQEVQISHGLAESLAQFAAFEQTHPGFTQSAAEFLDSLISHYVFDGGRLVVAHAGLKESMHGRGSGAVREFALYGETTGETDEFGLPVRLNWAADYRGQAMVLYGHTPVAEPEWLNHTMNLDTGCVYGGRLTALRYPEKELVSVPAARAYAQSARPFLRPPDLTPGPTLQQAHDDLLDLADVSGKRQISTRLHGSVTIRQENAAAALEVMSRFAANPQWLVYLPPTMSPCGTSSQPGLLEHPAEAFDYFRREGVTRVICEEKHMGSRTVLIVCRDEATAQRRFGVKQEGFGICLTRTGRRFFDDRTLETALLEYVRQAADRAGLWEELQTDWMVLDAELMPWSVKAQALLREQYAPVGAAAAGMLNEALRDLERAAQRGLDVTERLQRTAIRRMMTEDYIHTYRRYCWPVQSVADLRLAPFHLLASEGQVHTQRPHDWHLATLARLAGGPLITTTAHSVDFSQPDSEARAIAWWESLTANGGEGMVVKPMDFIARGSRGLLQPAVKCRGREYLRLIYGPEYTLEDNLTRLRSRGLNGKRSLALREFALGVEALERFVRREPLRRVHECVFGVLALESEPVDPRL